MQSLSPGAGSSTLKSAQLAAVNSMLSLPSADQQSSPYGDGGGAPSNPWKILVYDRHTRGIISPLLSVSALRERGVTLHLLLSSEREPIPGEGGRRRSNAGGGMGSGRPEWTQCPPSFSAVQSNNGFTFHRPPLP